MNRRGQITIFAVVGLILLLAVSLVFFIDRDVSEDKPGLDLPDVSIESRPAVELVETCLATTAEKGLRELGRQGGTLNPPSVSYPSYRGEAVLFTPDVIPFWRHLASCDNPSGCEVIFQPGLCAPGNKYCDGMLVSEDNIQETLEKYIDENIGYCIKEFEDLGKQYDIEVKGEPRSDVIFTQGVTQLFLNYPITITSMSTDNVQELEDYRGDVNVDIYSMYKLASEIIDFARESDYYERQTMNLVASYASVDNEHLPPIDHIQFFRNAAGPWVQSDVRETLQYDLLPFMSLVRFANVKNNIPLFEDDDTLGEYKQYSEGFYTSFLPKTSNIIYEDFDVYHNYVYEPIYSKVGDGSPVIKGTSLIDSGSDIVSMLIGATLEDYRFNYDISYPLLISIEDDDAFNGAGYTFQFAIEVNVRNNIPGYTNFTFYNTAYEQTLDLESLHLDQEITLETFDRYTGEPLDDVSVSYVCGNEYELGLTEFVDSKAVLTTTMPYCEFGGYITFSKDGYLGSSLAYNNREGGDDMFFEFKLWPIKEREVIVLKRTADNIAEIRNAGTDAMWIYATEYENLSVNDMVLLNVERVIETPYDQPVPLLSFLRVENKNSVSLDIDGSMENAILLGFEEGFYTEEERDELLAGLGSVDYTYNPPERYVMDFVPGTFMLDATLMDKKGMFLSSETIDLTDESASLIGKLITSGSTEFEFPAQNFTTWITGGNKLNFTLSPAQAYRDEPFTFYVLEQEKPTNWMEFMNMKELDEELEEQSMLLYPKYD